MTVINTNVAATVTANAMKSNQRSMESTMERLATGVRINSAKDDAAGLAIGTKMTSQVRGFEQAVRNANDGISMLQTADGAAEQITGLLQRMRELAVQGQNDTNSTSDLDNLNEEFIALATEIDRIADDTQFNGKVLLDASTTVTLTIGADEADVIDVTMGDFNLAAGATSTKRVDTLTINVTKTQALGANASKPGSAITLTDGDGNTLSIDQTKIAATAATSGFGDATLTEVVAAINTAIDAAGSGFADMDAALDGSTGITFTQDVAGTGSITNVSISTGAVVSTGSLANTQADSSATSASPMATDLSTYKAAGDHVEATSTIANLDAAIAGVNTARADFGANISRLGYTIDNLSVSITNTQAARSAVMDADYASETTELARTQIISQAATAMLSQANQQAQSVLALLK